MLNDSFSKHWWWLMWLADTLFGENHVFQTVLLRMRADSSWSTGTVTTVRFGQSGWTNTMNVHIVFVEKRLLGFYFFFLHKFVIFCVPNSEVMQDASSVTLLQTAIDEACSLRVLWLIVRSSLMRLCLLRLSNVLSCTQGTYVPSSAAFSRRQIAGRKSPRKCSDCQWHSQMLRRGHAWHWTSMKCFVALPKPFAPGTLGSLRLLRSLKLQIGRLKQTDRFQTCVY